MYRIYLIVCLFIALFINSAAKSQSSNTKDKSTSFKVLGVCEMCKKRIEKALKTKGVETADWDIDTKILSVVFDTTKITLDKIHVRIAEVGHDTELKQSNETTYKALPDCCHYREMDENGSHHDEGEVVLIDTASAKSHLVRGLIMEENNKGMFKPLEGATVIWMGTNKGTITNKEGMFEIEHEEGLGKLIVSYSGFKSDTISVENLQQVRIILASGNQLNEVKVTSKQAS